MGRKSALTPEQWAEISRRVYVGGESICSLAAEFGVNESSIRRKIKPDSAGSAQNNPEIRALAERKAAADAESERVALQIARMPIPAQHVVNDLSALLRSVSMNLALASDLGSKTARVAAHHANVLISKVDDADPTGAHGIETLKGVAALTKLANEASSIGLNLLNANRDRMPAAEVNETPSIDVTKLSNEALMELLGAARPR